MKIMIWLDTDFWSFEKSVTFPPELLNKLQSLPIRSDIEFRFVDFDGTLADDDVRFRVDPELLHHRGDDALPYIAEKYASESDPTGIKTFVEKIKDKLREEGKPFIFHNTEDFFDPHNPYHFILTAWSIQLQGEKINSSRLSGAKNKLLVPLAEQKPLEILLTCLEAWFIPGSIKFYDDRIHNFDGVDTTLSQVLRGIQVHFYRATPDYEKSMVAVETYRSEVARILTGK